ncbi:MAG TPA: hypothetical protein VK487_09460 [Candidatus Bathyarchaeia archaeon]|nr:hypothetical protein [Candidatus Bathyarchaeia archaeon]
MKCNDVMTFLSQLSSKSITFSITGEDLNFLVSSGYIQSLSKDDYNKLASSVADLPRITNELEEARAKGNSDEATLIRDQKKVHSIRFWFEGHEKKEADREKAQADQQVFSKDEEMVKADSDELQPLIQKKSMLDRQVPFGERYLSLTGSGVVLLHDLTVRNYRVGEKDVKNFIQETKATEMELKAMAQRASFYYSAIKDATSSMDTSPLASSYDEYEEENEDAYRIKSKGVESSQLWAVSIGLAKLEGDPAQIKKSFLQILNTLGGVSNSNLDSKLMAAETLLAAGRAKDASQNINKLATNDRQLRQSANVPEELSTGVTATLYSGANPDASTRYNEFSKITRSYTAAAVLSSSPGSEESLSQKFDSFRSLFDSWGYSSSEDTDLAAAYLTISPLSRDDARNKMSVILDAIKAVFEFPLVPAAILTSIQALSANEVLDLMEKAVTILQSQPLTMGLSHSDLSNLAIRMIYGQ